MQRMPLQHISKSLRARFDPIAQEPLPGRWVELIRYLNEKEEREKQVSVVDAQEK